MSSEFNIYPNITVTTRIVKGRISVFDYIPFTSAGVACMLYDANDKAVENRVYLLDGNDFLSWGSDDKYLVEWVKQKLKETI